MGPLAPFCPVDPSGLDSWQDPSPAPLDNSCPYSKGLGGNHGIGLLEPIWKVIERIIDHQLDAFDLHDSLHGCRNKHSTGTAIIEAKLAQQLAYLELKLFYGVFLDLRKAFYAMVRERCILILEGYGAGPWLVCLVRTHWRDMIVVCRALGYYGTAFRSAVVSPKAGRYHPSCL